MNEYHKKVMDEANELDIKLEKLRKFLLTPEFQNLSHHHKSLLRIQENAMTTYFEVLSERIDLFNKEKGE